MKIPALALGLTFVGTIPSAFASSGASDCPGFGAGAVNPETADHFYRDRALAVMRAAIAGDTATLASQVRPDARYAIWRGDYSTSARQVGVPGAVEMARDLKPVSWQFQTASSGPLSVVPVKCEWSVTLLFRTADARLGVLMKFEFQDGRLIKASGHEVILSEASLRPAPWPLGPKPEAD
jgi:hypothetical protein